MKFRRSDGWGLLEFRAMRFVRKRLPGFAKRDPRILRDALTALGVDALMTSYLDEYEILIDPSGASITDHVLSHGSYQLELAELASSYLDLAQVTVVNVGANIGTAILNLHAHGCRNFIAIEPVRKNVSLLRRNVEQLTDSSSIEILAQAIGPERGKVKINLHPSSGGRHSVVANFGGASEEVICAPIDDLDLRGPVLLWIDTEGFEHEVLLSAVKFITTNRPPICFEISPKIAGPHIIDLIGDMLDPLGYRYIAVGCEPVHRLADLPGIRNRGQTDVIALPPSG